MSQPPTTARQSSARPVQWLVCFAVREEMEPLSAFAVPRVSTAFEVTGMGFRNASNAIQAALETWRPEGIITAGFAGGLNPELKRGTVVFDPDDELGITGKLHSLSAMPARFHCAPRIAITAVEKAQLRKETGADVVEMESAIIRAACRNAGIPSATIRVISDAAEDELPLDFNGLMTPADRINWWKFARAIVFRPATIGRLIAFQRQTRLAARELGRVLKAILKHAPPRGRGQGVP